jgi:carboxylesterase type B
MLSKSIITLLSITAVHAQSTWTVGQAVKTTSGNIVGQVSSWKKDVSEYLGVPFAAPPVGPLRWAPPQKFKGEGKTIQATKFVCSSSNSRYCEKCLTFPK